MQPLDMPWPAAAPLPSALARPAQNLWRMARLQAALKRLDAQLHALLAVEDPALGRPHSGGAATENEGEDNMEREREREGGAGDPALAAMLSAELCRGCAAGDAALVRALLEGGADPDSRDYDGVPPLHIAAANGRAAVVAALLEGGAEVFATDRCGRTARDVAEANGFDKVVQLLTVPSAKGEERTATNTNTNTTTPTGGVGGLDSIAEKPTTSRGPSSPNSLLAPPFSSVPQPMVGLLVVVMVGLPGRGKSYIAQQIRRYFQWNGLQCKVFAHQSYQRKHLKKGKFDGAAGSVDIREPLKQTDVGNQVILDITADMVTFVSKTDGVAILDGTNTTNARRQAILRAFKGHQHITQNRVVFVEIVTNDKETIHRNIMRSREMVVSPPDNFEKRYYENIAQHELAYETLNRIRDSELSYIRIQDNNLYFLNMISGWMPSRLAYILHNLNQSQQNVYLTRAGEYVNLISGRIGGNSELTDRGVAYSLALFNFFKEEVGTSKLLLVMSSSSTRCMQTARYFAEESAKRESHSRSSFTEEKTEEVQLNCHVDYVPSLEDISYGDCEGQLLTDIRKTMLSTLQSIQADSYYTPWPNGECVHHVFNTRLEPQIHDIQASSIPVLVMSHRTLLQGLYAYFVTKDTQVVAPQNACQIKIPLETVVKIHIVGVHRVAELVNLSKEVDRIELEMTGKITRAPRVDINKCLASSQSHSNLKHKGISKPVN